MKSHPIKSINLASALIAIAFCSNAAVGGTVSLYHHGTLENYFSLNTAPGSSVKYYQRYEPPYVGWADIDSMTDTAHTTAVVNRFFNGAFLAPHTQITSKITVQQEVIKKDAINDLLPMLQLGVVSDLNERMDGEATANAYASVRLMPSTTATATDVRVQVETRNQGLAAPILTDIGSEYSLISGRRYTFSTTFEYETDTSILVSASLRDRTTNMMVFNLNPVLIPIASTGTIINDNRLWPAFRAFDEGGADRLGYISYIPEPTTLSLLGIGFLLIRRRR